MVWWYGGMVVWYGSFGRRSDPSQVVAKELLLSYFQILCKVDTDLLRAQLALAWNYAKKDVKPLSGKLPVSWVFGLLTKDHIPVIFVSVGPCAFCSMD